MQISTRWQLDGNTARLACGSLRATADLAAPQRGLALLHHGNAPLAGWLLGVTAQGDFAAAGRSGAQSDRWEPSDAYVRGDDLVVAYGAGPELPFGMQIYWRAGELTSRRGVVLDAIVSIQTRAWEAFPEVSVTSALAINSADVDGDSVVLRHLGLPWSYAEVAKPGDFKQDAFNMGNGNMGRIAWTFGREFMERGVIRRLQIRGAFVPADDDGTIVEYLRESLQAEAPPLTA